MASPSRPRSSTSSVAHQPPLLPPCAHHGAGVVTASPRSTTATRRHGHGGPTILLHAFILELGAGYAGHHVSPWSRPGGAGRHRRWVPRLCIRLRRLLRLAWPRAWPAWAPPSALRRPVSTGTAGEEQGMWVIALEVGTKGRVRSWEGAEDYGMGNDWETGAATRWAVGR